MPAQHPADIVDRLLKLGAQVHVEVSALERMDIADTCSTAANEIRGLRHRVEGLQARLDASPKYYRAAVAIAQPPRDPDSDFS